MNGPIGGGRALRGLLPPLFIFIAFLPALRDQAAETAVVPSARVVISWDPCPGLGEADLYELTAWPADHPRPKTPAVVEIEVDDDCRPLGGDYPALCVSAGAWIFAVRAVARDGRASKWIQVEEVIDGAPTGVRDPAPAPARIVFCPNPSDGRLKIISSLEGALEIFNVAGRRLYSLEVLEGVQGVDLELPAGVYFARIGAWRGRLVIVK